MLKQYMLDQILEGMEVYIPQKELLDVFSCSGNELYSKQTDEIAIIAATTEAFVDCSNFLF